MNKIFSDFNFQSNPSEKELIEKLKNNKDVNKLLKDNGCDLELIDKYPYQFLDWLNVKKVCDGCTSLDSCPFNKGCYIDICLDNNYPTKVYKKCHLLKQYQQEIKHKDNYLVCHLSDNQLKYSFDSTDLTYESDKYMSTFAIVKQYLKQNNKKGIYFLGPIGVGKTYLACCLTNQFAIMGKKVSFVHVPTFTSDIKFNLFDNNYVDGQIDLLKRSEILVLDDIGAENQTAFIRDEVLLPLLDYRMENGKLTFFTSNCSLDELKKRFAQIGNSYDEVKAERIIERIKVLSEVITLQGKSRRNV